MIIVNNFMNDWLVFFFVGGKTRSCGIGMGYQISIVINVTN